MTYKGGLFIIFVIAITMLAISIYYSNQKAKECDSRGGVLVQTPAGWACVKLERV